MDVSQTREKLQEVLSSLDMNEDMKELFFYMLEPLIQEHLEILIENAIPENQANELALQGLEQGFDEKEIAYALQVLYEKKTGKSLQDEVNVYVESLTNNIKEMQTQMNTRLEEIMKLPPDKREEAIQNDILQDLEVKQDE